MLPLAVFTVDNEQIFTGTLDLSVQACKNASLNLTNRLMLHGHDECCMHAVESRSPV